MLSNSELQLLDELLSTVRHFLKDWTPVFGKKIRVQLTWRAWKILELWFSGLALATRKQGVLYDLRVTTGAVESVCSASFESLGNKFFNETSVASSSAICIELDFDEFMLIMVATNHSLKLFSQVGAHVGISLSLCVPTIGCLRDLVLIQATPMVFELGGFRDGAITIKTINDDEFMIRRGRECSTLSELMNQLRNMCEIGLR